MSVHPGSAEQVGREEPLATTQELVILSGQMKPVAVTEFKARCLSMLEDVARTGKSLVITKRGKPLARIVPTGDSGGGRPQDGLFGTVETLGDVISPVVPAGVWNAARGVLVMPSRPARRPRPARRGKLRRAQSR